MCARLLVLAALAIGGSNALNCFTNGGNEDWTPSSDCSDEDVAEFCFAEVTDDSGLEIAGCIPTTYEAALIAKGIDLTQSGCDGDICWCATDNCNTESLAIARLDNWVPPPLCYGGVGGANVGPSCTATSLYNEQSYEMASCSGRGLSARCVENNEHVGMGDGCDTWDDEDACTGYDGDEEREEDDSFDGTSNHCRWIPAKTKSARGDECEADGECSWDSDGNNCGSSSSSEERRQEWLTHVGVDCENRARSGCFENNDHFGENDQCTRNDNENSCLLESGGDHCSSSSSGACSGDSGCETGRDSEWECEHTLSEEEMQYKCESSDLYHSTKYTAPSCHDRVEDSMCVENNDWVGKGDGCAESIEDPPGSGTWVQEFADEDSCTTYRAGERDASSSFDGTSNHCRWIPTMSAQQKDDSCETDDDCVWDSEDGDSGSCSTSDGANAKQAEWDAKVGTDCGSRLRVGCYENNDHFGTNMACTNHDDEGSCVAEDYCGGGDDPTCCKWVPEPDDLADTCATSGAGTATGLCSFKEAREQLSCTWEPQCCQWSEPPGSVEQACTATPDLDGAMAGMCQYTDGNGPPSAELVGAGFERGMFTLGPHLPADGKCAMIASFRNGFGSASAFGANKAKLVQNACYAPYAWQNLAEHIGHDEDSIEEYCENFVPDDSAMNALSEYSPGEIIAAAKSGNFATTFPGLADNLFIVTSKPEFGECLFTAGDGSTSTFGLAVCTCEGEECNNQKALEFIVDPELGPMRLLQFLDGSLLELKDAINSIVDGLLDDKGRIERAVIGSVTLENVQSLMAIDGLAALTNVEEVWRLVQDFQNMAAHADEDPGEETEDLDGIITNLSAGATDLAAGFAIVASLAAFAML